MLRPQDGRILFLIKALVALLFLSKISFAMIPGVPWSFSFLLFQSGLHPYLNVFLSFLFGVPLFFMWLRVRERHHLSGFYKLFVFLLMMTLSVQTLLQVHFLSSKVSFVMHLGALITSLFMIVIYGLIIPSLWSVEPFLKLVQRWSGVLVTLSLMIWPLAGSEFFKGGRFIGVFKHIPHMVTCSTVAFVFSLGTYVAAKSAKERYWSLWVLAVSFVTVVLTGTRSSAAAILMALLLTLILHKSLSNRGRILKVSAVGLLLSFTVLFGGPAFEFAHGIATGESSLGTREAQDGVASRWDEVERGMEIFDKDPWLGQGLLSKFSGGDGVDVSRYNAMKDPHNILISAGVIGGWPLLVLSVFSLVLMVVGGLKALGSTHPYKRQLAIYLLAHIPILVIYHVHLSLGGMADRMYWMVFGFIAASITFVEPHKEKPHTN